MAPTRNPNKTMFVLFLFVIAFLIFLYHIHYVNIWRDRQEQTVVGIDPSTYLLPRPPVDTIGLATRFDVLRDPYVPPVKVDGYVFQPTSDIRGLPPLVAPIQTPLTVPTTSAIIAPVNIETRGVRNEYSQVGILTKFSQHSTKSCDDCGDSSSRESLILPLMGRRHLTGRDKWQYYTISNTGFLNTKLPVKVNGRSCSSEYGCDQIMNGDLVYVDGYDHKFKATIYDNAMFSYLPVL